MIAGAREARGRDVELGDLVEGGEEGAGEVVERGCKGKCGGR